eukprot:scaffold113110_cov63-Phaeocystis_antarctica.AAC.2
MPRSIHFQCLLPRNSFLPGTRASTSSSTSVVHWRASVSASPWPCAPSAPSSGPASVWPSFGANSRQSSAGVATMTRAASRSSARDLVPGVTMRTLALVSSPSAPSRMSAQSSSPSCEHSSLVGLSTSSWEAGSSRIRHRAGSMNANDLPLPVSACSTSDSPESARSSAAAWTGVGAVMPRLDRPSTTDGGSAVRRAALVAAASRTTTRSTSIGALRAGARAARRSSIRPKLRGEMQRT